MSLFHFTHRHAKLEDGNVPALYPQNVTLDIRFGPEDAFGVSCKPRTFARRGSAIDIHWNVNEGVLQFEGDLIDKLDGVREAEYCRISLNGNRLQLTRRVNSVHEAVKFAGSANQCLPGFLSFRFRTYVWIKEFLIRFDGSRLRFGLAEAKINIPAATTEENKQRVWSCLDDWSRTRSKHRRLLGAIYYYRQALRLSQLQLEQIALTPELVLNLTKALEIIFGTNREIARKKAKSLGLTDKEIEKCLIPILLIRSEFDIAHVATGPLSPKERQIVVDFSSRATATIGRILERVAEAGFVGNFEFDRTSPTLDKDKKKLIKALDRYNRETV
jgi:hypothetical protein